MRFFVFFEWNICLFFEARELRQMNQLRKIFISFIRYISEWQGVCSLSLYVQPLHHIVLYE